MPTFSVIIPLYNKENYIENTLKSVLQQTFDNFEIIIVNDGSTDNSEQKILNFNDSRIRYYSKINEGASKARNFGIEKAKADYICFIDADDYWYPEFLSTFHSVILNHKTQKVFSCAIEIETYKKKFQGQYSIQTKSGVQIVDYFKSSLKNSIISTSSVVLHKDIFKKVGVFDPTIKSGQDTDLWIRVGLDYNIVFINIVLATYVFDEKSLSRSVKDFNKSLKFEKYAEFEKTNKDLKKFLDYNRVSLAIKAKLQSDYGKFIYFKKDIDYRNLPLKKIILIHLPQNILQQLYQSQKTLFNLGLKKSLFK